MDLAQYIVLLMQQVYQRLVIQVTTIGILLVTFFTIMVVQIQTHIMVMFMKYLFIVML